MPVTDTLTHDQAEQLARDLMQQHGLTDSGWHFKWSHGKRRLGATQISKARDAKTGKLKEIKTILLSTHLVDLNPEPVVRDVILHEIAHALAGIKNGHNHVWQAMCKKIGAKPQRLADEKVEVIEGRYAIVCTSCDTELGRRHRRTSPAHLRSAYCKHCGPKSAGKLKLTDKLPQ